MSLADASDALLRRGLSGSVVARLVLLLSRAGSDWVKSNRLIPERWIQDELVAAGLCEHCEKSANEIMSECLAGDDWMPALPQPPVPPPDLARTDAPSFLEKVRNFASAAVSHVAAGMPMCSDEEIIRRHDICLSCEHLKDNACQLCGCPVARAAGYVSKLSWADQECPAGKWGKAPSA
jgi:hypothetical protein